MPPPQPSCEASTYAQAFLDARCFSRRWRMKPKPPCAMKPMFRTTYEVRDISPPSKNARAREELWEWTSEWVERAKIVAGIGMDAAEDEASEVDQGAMDVTEIVQVDE